MSWQACTWAVTQQVVTDPAARHVLLLLANYASITGEDVWPSAATIAKGTGLSIRTVRYKLDDLEAAGLLLPGDERVLALKVPQADKRPKIYNLNLDFYGVQDLQAGDERPATDDTNGLQLTTERPAPAAPNKVINNHTRKQELSIVSKPGMETYSEGFDRFWDAFPAIRKGSKAAAFKVWVKLKLEDDADFIVQNVELKVKSHRKWIDGFAPMATTYLNQSGWTEPLETTGSQGHAKETPFERTQRLQQESREDLLQRARSQGWDF